MSIPTIGLYAIIFHLATYYGALRVHAASFHGPTSTSESDLGVVGDGRQPQHGHHRALQPDPCASKKNNECDGGCAWYRGSCIPVPTLSPTHSPMNPPTNPPTTSSSSSSPTTSPTDCPTVAQQTYCGCPQCTTSIWNTDACNGSECDTCGNRITFKRSSDGGSMPASEACSYVANEFPDGPCGPECNPEVCNADDPTSAPTPNPTTTKPTKSPSDVTPSPTPPPTPPPTEQFFCGCDSCTTDVWDYTACNGNECYTCGSRISFLQTTYDNTEEQACTQVSNEFPNNECGPACSPLLCNPEYLDKPDEENLIWYDEFDVDGAPDSNKWGYDLGDGCSVGICKWGNSEEQVYTSDPNNVIVSGGILHISAKRTSPPPKPGYTSTRMVTRGKKAFRYGRIRFRASLANCQAIGTWPALWMLPEDWVHGGWPSSGEIDVMETVGYEADKFFGTVHTEAYNHGIGTERGGSLSKSKDEWHIFEIDWQADNIRFAVDRQVFYQFTPGDISDYKQWPFDQDFHLLMNIAVGGSWGGAQGVDAASFEEEGQAMGVDWVRVYSS